VDGVPRQNLAFVVSDEVLAVWLREPSAPTWDEFKQKAEQQLGTLKAIGVEVDYEPGSYVSDIAMRDRYTEAIQRATEERTGRMRHAIPSEHDGELLCIAHCVRSARRARPDDGLWPGAAAVASARSLACFPLHRCLFKGYWDSERPE